MKNGQGRAILSVPFERSDFDEQAHFSIIERCIWSLATASLFRRDVVRLITDEGCYIPAAAKVCGTNDQTVRNWHGRFASVPVSAGDDATVEELPVAEVARHSVHVR